MGGVAGQRHSGRRMAAMSAPNCTLLPCGCSPHSAHLQLLLHHGGAHVLGIQQHVAVRVHVPAVRGGWGAAVREGSGWLCHCQHRPASPVSGPACGPTDQHAPKQAHRSRVRLYSSPATYWLPVLCSSLHKSWMQQRGGSWDLLEQQLQCPDCVRPVPSYQLLSIRAATPTTAARTRAA